MSEIASAITDEQVIAFLQQNPNFFDQHPDLVLDLDIHHHSGASVSLLDHKIQLLQKESVDLKQKLKQIHQIAADNEHLLRLCLQLTQRLLSAKWLDQALVILQEQFRTQFQMPLVSIKLFAHPHHQHDNFSKLASSKQQAQTVLTSDMLSNKPFCGIIRENQMAYLFDGVHQNIASVAIIPLGFEAELGVIALGGERQDTFTAEMDTLFLDFIRALLGQLLPNWLSAH